MSQTNSQVSTQELASLYSVLNNVKTLPYCTSTIPLNEGASTIFYRSALFNSKPEHINFVHPTDSQLETLAKACRPATFGTNHQDTYDRAPFKAGELDLSQFSTPFHPDLYGMAEVLSSELLKGHLDMQSIHIELNKLNVFGPGGFVKGHVNVACASNVFGSLVVILPTVFEGGAFVLRHQGKEWTFDSSNAVKSSEIHPAPPHAAAVAFFRDVEQEVTTVSSGYLVTLTYNLSIPSRVVSNSLRNTVEGQLQDALSRLLRNPLFLPKGGFLAFSLDHKYPIRPGSTLLGNIEERLKGMDRSIKSACDSLILDNAPKAVYGMPQDTRLYDPEESGFASTADFAIVLDEFAGFRDDWGVQTDAELATYLSNRAGAVVAYAPGQEGDVPRRFRRLAAPMAWVQWEISEKNTFTGAYIREGDNPFLKSLYGEVCLIAKVLPAPQRRGYDVDDC